MRHAMAMLVILLGLCLSQPVWARGGQAADDCPAGSTDPDCKDSAAAKGK